MNWYLDVLKKYATFSGRARRKEFWMFTLINVLIMIALTVLDMAVLQTGVLAAIYSLAVLIPTLAVGARRLHDTGRSGWMQLIWLIPLVGPIIVIVFFASAGAQEPNAHGANPKFGYDANPKVDPAQA